MEILKIRERLSTITGIFFAGSSEVNKEINRLQWSLQQLIGKEVVQSIQDLKRKQKSIKTEDLDDIRRMVMAQRRQAKKDKKEKSNGN